MKYKCSEKNFLRCLLLLPIIFGLMPYLLALFSWPDLAQGNPISMLFAAASVFLFGSLLIAGIPYVILCVLFLIASFRWKASQFYRHLLLAPCYLMLLLAIYILIISFIYSNERSVMTVDFLKTIAELGVFCLVLGYLYVLLGVILHFFAKRRGWLTYDN